MVRRRALRFWLGAAGIAFLVVAGALAFVLPWTSLGDEGDDVPINRYVRFEDGRAALVRMRTTDGDVAEWQSTAIDVVPGLRALGDLPSEFEDAVAQQIAGRDATVNDALADHDALTRARVGVVNRQRLLSDGSTVSEIEVQVLDQRGLFTVGFRTLGGNQLATIVDPPIPLLPPEPHRGAKSSAEGTLGGLPYRWHAEVVETGSVDSELGTFDDCITVESSLALETTEGDDVTEYTDEYCRDAGWVHGEIAGSSPASFDTVSAGTGRVADLPAEPAPVASEPDAPVAPPGDPSEWRLTRVGSTLPLTSTGISTFPPVYLPTDPPTVVASTDADGSLVALAAGDLSGTVRWRFPTAGAVYSQPRVDVQHGRIYFGASDGVLRALDFRGLYLWGVDTGDNIATRPAVVDDTVVFGSEDGKVYAVDVDGAARWTVSMDEAVVSSPVVFAGRVVVADQSGSVRALDPATGATVWQYGAAGGVEGALATTARGVLVPDSTGTVALVDKSGDELWSADVGDGFALRTEPAVLDDLAVVVDGDGDLHAVDLDDGRIVWERAGREYDGAPGVAGGAVVIARERGLVDIVDAGGDLVRVLDARDASAPTDLPPDFSYGPGVGGGAFWLADDRGIIRKLAPAQEAERTALSVAWAKTMIDPPFGGFPMVITPAVWRDQLVVVDTQRNMFLVDPATGTAATVGPFGQQGDALLVDPVVAGDVMLVDARNELVAIELPSGQTRWSYPLQGQRFHPPVVAGDVVVVVNGDGDAAAIEGIDLADGHRLWRATTGAGALSGGPVLGDGVVYAGDPVAAFAPDTGDQIWESSVTNVAGQGTVVGDEFVTATYVPGADSGGVAALDPDTGAVNWQRDLVNEGLGATGRLLGVEGVVVLHSVTGPVIGIDSRNGAEVWRHDPPAGVIGTPSLLDGHVWLALESGQVLTLDPVDGEVRAAFEGFGTDIGAISLLQRPVGIGDTVIVAAGQILFAVEEASS